MAGGWRPACAPRKSCPTAVPTGVLPVTPGATLVVIYRVMSKTEPLRAVVIYDGAFFASAGNNLHQTVRGFFDADSSSPSKLAYLWSHAGSWARHRGSTVCREPGPSR